MPPYCVCRPGIPNGRPGRLPPLSQPLLFIQSPLANEAIIDGQYIDIAMLVNRSAMSGEIPLLPMLDAARANDPPGCESSGQIDWPS